MKILVLSKAHFFEGRTIPTRSSKSTPIQLEKATLKIGLGGVGL